MTLLIWPLSVAIWLSDMAERSRQRRAQRIALKALKAEARQVHQFWENMRRTLRRT